MQKFHYRLLQPALEATVSIVSGQVSYYILHVAAMPFAQVNAHYSTERKDHSTSAISATFIGYSKPNFSRPNTSVFIIDKWFTSMHKFEMPEETITIL